MKLVVDNIYVYESFLSFLKRRILWFAMSHLSRGKLIVFDELFKAHYPDKVISSTLVLHIAFSHLSTHRDETTTTIEISDKILYPGTNLKILDLCRIINYGTVDVGPYPIISEVFDYFSTHLELYAEKFTMGLG